MNELEKFLDQHYDHVLTLELSNIKIGQLICVNRNIHNGDTKHIKVQAKIQDNGNLYIAGDYTK